MPDRDGALSHRLAAGDAQAFAEVYDAWGPSLYRYVLSQTGRVDAAEDLLQATWLRLVRHRRRLRGVKSVRAYLFGMARNELRRAGRRRPSPVDPATLDLPVSDAVGDADTEALCRALARLDALRREVVELKAWHGLTFAEIGEVLDCSPNTAASRWRLGLEELERRLAPERSRRGRA